MTAALAFAISEEMDVESRNLMEVRDTLITSHRVSADELSISDDEKLEWVQSGTTTSKIVLAPATNGETGWTVAGPTPDHFTEFDTLDGAAMAFLSRIPMN